MEIKNISKKFDGLIAVNDVSFDIEKGSINALIGPNGAGKTTMFNIITGFLSPQTGSVYYKGENLINLPPHKIARNGITRTFQKIRLFPQMTVLDNLMLGAKYETGESLIAALFKSKKMIEEDQMSAQKALECLDIVGLGQKRDENAENLSQGQRKLIEFARILVTNPDVIFLDEPTAGVFPNTRLKIIELIRKLQVMGKTVVFIEHDMKFVMEISDKIIVMNHGEKIAEGIPETIKNNGTVIDAYLGRRR